MPSLLSMGAGASEALDNVLQRWLLEAKLKSQADNDAGHLAELGRHNRANEDLLDREHTLRSMDSQARIREAAANHAEQAQNRDIDNGRALGEAIPGDTFLPNGDPAIGMMERGGVGSLLKMKSSLPSTSTTGVSTLPGNDNPEAASSVVEEKPQEIGRIKLKSAAQTKPAGGYNKEQKTVLYKGRPVEAIFDPRDETYKLPGGEDITKDVGHYEKPPSPDRVLIQTGDGYMRRGDANAKLGAGEEVPLAETSSTRTMREGATNLLPHIKSLEGTATELDKRGLFGPVMSRVRELAAKFGTTMDSSNPDEAAKAYAQLGEAIKDDPQLNNDRLVGKFASSLGLMATGAGRVHGGARGGGSVQMLEHFKALLSGNATLSMFLGRMDALDEYMTGYASKPGAEKPKVDDLYQQYLNRTATKPK